MSLRSRCRATAPPTRMRLRPWQDEPRGARARSVNIRACEGRHAKGSNLDNIRERERRRLTSDARRQLAASTDLALVTHSRPRCPSSRRSAFRPPLLPPHEHRFHNRANQRSPSPWPWRQRRLSSTASPSSAVQPQPAPSTNSRPSPPTDPSSTTPTSAPAPATTSYPAQTFALTTTLLSPTSAAAPLGP